MTSFNPQSLYDHDVLKQPRPIDSTDNYQLTWRLGKLLVGFSHQIKQPYLPPLERQEWLVDCLSHSPAQQVGLEPTLGEARLRFWAEASLQADKTVFLRLPSNPTLPRKQQPLHWWVKCSIDRIVATLLLLLLSPLMLGLGLMLAIDGADPIFVREWRVGERGKLFQVLKFRTHQTRLQPWLQKYRLHELPQLVNVLQGDMSLVGPRPLNLREATQLRPQERQRLNLLPGLTGIWRSEEWQFTKTPVAAGIPHGALPTTVHQAEAANLPTWSLWKDAQSLLSAVAKVFSSIRQS
jgi:lipopolysaccharide/colanic/teichoic acid biosynthesis glycosyltransferase